jgi:hypothetical protein
MTVTNLKMITKEMADVEIAKYTSKYNQIKTCSNDRKEILMAKAYVDIWERVKHHLDNGKMMTIDDEGHLHLLSDEKNVVH